MNERVFLKEQLALPDAPVHLEALIKARIERATMQRIWTEVGIAFTVTFALVSYILFSWSTVWLEIQESSFLQLVRLSISDPDILLSHFQETGWSFIEAIPVQSVLLVLGTALCLTVAIGLGLRAREVRQNLALRLT